MCIRDSSRTLGMQTKCFLYIEGSILSWWKGDVDGALDSWSCLTATAALYRHWLHRSQLGKRQFPRLFSLLQVRKFKVKVAYYHHHNDHHHHCNLHHCDHHQNQLITKILKIIKHVKKSEKLKIVKIIKNHRILRNNCFQFSSKST